MKKLFYIIALLLGSVFIIDKAQAATLKLYYEMDVSYHWADGSNEVDQASFFYMDNAPTFCVEPHVETNYGYEYRESWNWDDTRLSASLKDKVVQISYYGWWYTGHQTNNYRLATQAMIWEAVTNSPEGYYTYNDSGARYDISAERKEIKRLIEEHNKKPSFNGTTSNLNLGQSKVLTDSNNVLANFKVASCTNCNATINGNKLTINPTGIGNYQVNLEKKSEAYDRPTIYYISDYYQNQILTGNIDSVTSSVSGVVSGGKLTLRKYDADNKSCKAQNGGSLVGAVYKLYKEDGTFIKDLTIGSDCTASASNLEIARYYVQESKAGKNYEIDPEKHYFDVTSEKPEVVLTVYDKMYLGKVKIKKLDKDTGKCNPTNLGSLTGTEFDLYKKDGTFIKKLVIDNNCEAEATDLLLGDYYLIEKKAGKNYELDSKREDFSITKDGLTITKTFYNKIYLGKIKIQKLDNDTNSCNPQGKAKLVGAVYGVYDNTGKLVTKVTIGDNCVGETDRILLLNDYTVKEITSPVGYRLDPSTYRVSVTKDNADGIINVVSKDAVYTTYLHINKTYLTENGVNAEVGAKFDIISKTTKKVVATLTIDESATASVKLPFDDYIVRQTKGMSGYKLTRDIDFSVTEKSKENEYITLLNEPYSAKIRVKKIDTEGNAVPISGIRFKIFDVTNNKYVCQKGTYPDVATYCEVETDENGEFITLDILYPGRYRLEEVDQPIQGYVWNENGLEFEINENSKIVYDESLGEDILDLEFANQEVKGLVELYKIGEKVEIKDGNFTYIEAPLPNVTFGLFDEKGNLIKEYVTDDNGYIRIENLKLGHYTLKELKTLDNFILDESVYEIDLDYQDQYTPIISKSFTNKNYLKKGKLVFTKTDLTNGEAIEGVVIDIYTENDELIFSGVTDSEGKIVVEELYKGKFYILEREPKTGYRKNEEKLYFEIKENNEVVKAKMTNKKYEGDLEFTKEDIATGEGLPGAEIEIYNADTNELVFKGVTDESGKLVVKALEYGRYRIVEKVAPNSYVINDEPMYFEITEDGQIYKAVMTDRKITGGLEFTKEDLKTGETLPNAEIEIYNVETNELVYKGTTDENGKVLVENLEYGSYKIIEKKSPESYLLSDEPVYFEIKIDGEIVKSVMKNKKITGGLKFTKEDFSTDEPIPNTEIEIHNATTDEVIYSGKTNEDGKIILEEIPYGDYYILEKNAPIPYTLNLEKMYFSIKEDGEVIKATMKDKVITSKIILHKIDENKKGLEGVTIGIYKKDGTLINAYVTDKNGNIELELEYGDYYFQELKGLDNFKLTDEKIYFSVTEDGAIIEKTLVNELEETEVPNTNKNDDLMIFINTLLVIGLGMTLYGIYKKRK